MHQPSLILRLVVVGATLAVSAGLTCRSPAEAQPSAASTPLRVERFRDGGTAFALYSGIRDSLRVVIRDDAAWQHYWALIHRDISPVPPIPRVDFAHDMVVLAALGQRASGGYDIRVDSAYGDGDGVEVLVRRSSPGRDCIVTAALTQPVDLARIPARSGPVLFLERTAVEDCN